MYGGVGLGVLHAGCIGWPEWLLAGDDGWLSCAAGDDETAAVKAHLDKDDGYDTSCDERVGGGWFGGWAGFLLA